MVERVAFALTNANPFRSGRHLAAARALAGLSQKELAQRASVTPRAARHWEAAKRMPPRGHALSRFAEVISACGVTITPTGVEVA